MEIYARGGHLQPRRRELVMALYMDGSESCCVVPNSCDPMDYAVHGILQARILEWVNFPVSRGSSQPRDRALVSRIAGGVFTS